MRFKSLEWIVLALASGAASGQTSPASGSNPGESSRVFYFANIGTVQAMNEIATSARIIADAPAVSVDEAKKSLTVRGTADQITLAEWLFTNLDIGTPVPANSAAREYRLPDGSEAVHLYRLNRGQSVQDFQELATATRTIGDIRRVSTYNELKIFAVRGTPDQLAMTDWLIPELEKSAGQPRGHSVSAEYFLPADPAPRENENVMRVLYTGNAAKIQDFQEAATLLRTIAGIRRVYTYNAPRAIAVRGTADQLALAAWLFDQVDKPAVEKSAAPAPPSSIYHYQASEPGGDAIRVCYLAHTASVADFQKIATQIRSDAGIRWVYTYNAPRVLALRGTVDQIAQADRRLEKLDPQDFPTQQ